MFKPRPEPQLAPADSFRLKVADESIDGVIEELIVKADHFISQTDIEKPEPEEVSRIFGQFQLMVPAQHCRSFPDILNAAWRAYENEDLWVSMSDKARSQKEEILRDLVLKTVEIFEVEQILRQS